MRKICHQEYTEKQIIQRGNDQMLPSEKDYLKNLVPEHLSDWRKLLAEGEKIGKGIQVKKSRYMQEKGFENEVDLRLDRAAKGEITWRTIMGLATLEEHLEGLDYLCDFGKRTGVEIDTAMVIPNMLTGFPVELRENVPKGTSFVLESPEDWERIADKPIHPAFNDFHIGSPNAVANTVNAVACGCTYHGVFSQFTWNFPGCDDDDRWLGENIKALGIIASQRDRKSVVDTYMDDGIPSYFFDLSSYLGYACLEKYIVSDLCGARYASSFGQLLNKFVPKIALWLALSDVLKEDDQPGVSYYYANCIDHWDHDIEANYGFMMSEVIMAVAAERKYKTGVSILPIPITEKVAVPTPQSIANIHAAARKAAATVEEWERLIDFTPIEELRDKIKSAGTQFFRNILEGLEEAGIDTKNPLAMMILLKRIDPSKLETLFHPSTYQKENSVVEPLVPTSIGKQSLEEKDRIVKDLEEKLPGIRDGLRDRRVLVVSGDAHYYGAFVVSETLKSLGAEVVYGGVGLQPVDAMDIADEEGISDIMVSVHNGQALDYAKQLKQLSRSRDVSYHFYMGGKLNGILPGESEPRDVTSLIVDLGIAAGNDLHTLLQALLDQGV